MKISKFYILLFIIVFQSNLIFSMQPAGGSRRFREFMEELSKTKPSASTLSDYYYEIENETEQADALKAATKKSVKISGQEDEQKKIRKELAVESQKAVSPYEQFVRDLKAKVQREILNQEIKKLTGQDLTNALELAANNGVIFPEYPQQRQFASKSDKLADEYEKALLQADLLEQQNDQNKIDIHVRLTLSEQAQDKKEILAKNKKLIADLEAQIKNLSSQQEVKSTQVDRLLKSQNNQLKSANESARAELEKLKNRLSQLNSLKK